MKVHYVDDDSNSFIRPGVFLAGPTPRSHLVRSWRPAAIAWFEKFEFNGTLFVPESREGGFGGVSKDFQIKWEDMYLHAAHCIMFWIPRETSTMPGFTTNVEWGRWENSGKVVLGAPEEAEKMSYIRHYAKKHGVPMADTLEETVRLAIEMA